MQGCHRILLPLNTCKQCKLCRHFPSSSNHDLGCLFFTVANIRRMFRSTLKAILVVCVDRYEDISSYGLDAFLEPFVGREISSPYIDKPGILTPIYVGISGCPCPYCATITSGSVLFCSEFILSLNYFTYNQVFR